MSSSLDKEKARLAEELGSEVSAAGLFRRVEKANGILGVLLGIPLAGAFLILTVLIHSVIASAFDVHEIVKGGSLVYLAAVVAGFGFGRVAAARLSRKSKEVPDDFALAFAGDVVHILRWAITAVQPSGAGSLHIGKRSGQWGRRSVAIAPAAVQMDGLGLALPTTSASFEKAMEIWIDGHHALTAQILSVADSDGDGNTLVTFGPTSNEALDTLVAEQRVMK